MWESLAGNYRSILVRQRQEVGVRSRRWGDGSRGWSDAREGPEPRRAGTLWSRSLLQLPEGKKPPGHVDCRLTMSRIIKK